MAIETLYPQSHTDSGADWTNPSYAYNKDGTSTYAVLDKGLAVDTLDQSLLLYNWEAKTETYSALFIKAMWSTNDLTGDDQWEMQVSTNGGSTWGYTLLSQGTNRVTGTPFVANASVEIPADTTMSQVQVRLNLDKVKTADGDTINLFEVWSEGTILYSDDDTRGARITGAAAGTDDSDNRSARLKGVDTSGDNRDARLWGKDTDSDNRASRLKGVDTDNDNRGARLKGLDTDSDTRGATTMGYAWSICGSRVAKATFASYSPDIRDWIENEDVDVTGHDKSEYVILAVGLQKVATPAAINFSPDLYWRNVTDSGSWAKINNSSGEVRVTTSDVTDLVNGSQVVSGEEGCTGSGTYITGGESESSQTLPIYIYEYAFAGWGESHCALDLTNALNGKEYAFQLDDDVNGTGTVPGSIVTITIAGTVYDERSATLHGKNTDSSTRPARVSGKDTDTSTRPAKIHGVDTGSSERGVRLSGKDTDSNTRTARIAGKDTDSDTRGVRLKGKATTSDTIGAKLLGVDTDSSERGASLIGCVTSSGTRGARLTGKTNIISTSSTRGATLRGTGLLGLTCRGTIDTISATVRSLGTTSWTCRGTIDTSTYTGRTIDTSTYTGRTALGTVTYTDRVRS